MTIQTSDAWSSDILFTFHIWLPAGVTRHMPTMTRVHCHDLNVSRAGKRSWGLSKAIQAMRSGRQSIDILANQGSVASPTISESTKVLQKYRFQNISCFRYVKMYFNPGWWFQATLLDDDSLQHYNTLFCVISFATIMCFKNMSFTFISSQGRPCWKIWGREIGVHKVDVFW